MGKMIVTAHRYFPIDSYSDHTHIPSLDQEGGNQVITFHAKKTIEPGDDFSYKQFLTFKNKFINSCQRNRGGQFLGDMVEMDIPGLGERVVTIANNNGSLPWWARRKVFYILSVLSVSIFLRILFQTRSKRCNLDIVKKYFVYPLNRGRANEMDPGHGHGVHGVQGVQGVHGVQGVQGGQGGYEEYQPLGTVTTRPTEGTTSRWRSCTPSVETNGKRSQVPSRESWFPKSRCVAQTRVSSEGVTALVRWSRVAKSNKVAGLIHLSI